VLPCKQETRLNLLIIGGGDGRICHHLKQTYDQMIESVTIVEIDKLVSDVCDKYFEETVLFQDPKFN
jgi:spermidine synthase